MNKYVFRHMGALYRDYLSKMRRKYFYLKNTYQLRLKNRPTHVDVNDWKFLVNLWSEATYKDKSNKAKTSRGKRSMPAYSGTKSYARLRNQIEEKTGNEPSRLESQIEQLKKRREEGDVTSDDEVELLQKLEQTIKESNERVDEAKMEAIKQVEASQNGV
ncbi:hypothetical protein PTKIN_Ptkin06aG0134000 [Pterospermum kingtungense]